MAAAAVAAVAPIDPTLVERWYSEGVYLRLQPWLTRAANLFPFAIFDALLVSAVALTLGIAVAAYRAARRGGALRAGARGGFRLLTLGAVLYLWFFVVWGLNYRRVPLLERLDLRQGAPAAADVNALGRRAVEEMNALHAQAHAVGWAREPWRDAPLREAFDRTQRLLGDGPPAAAGRLKRTLLGPYFRWTGVDGMVNPFVLEVLRNPDLLPFEMPFVAAHEWAHLAGYADESEASFVGWLTCMRGAIGDRYSGWLFLYWQINGDVDGPARLALAAALGPGPRADIEAVTARLRRGQLPELRRASWAAYDQYLKANRVEQGVRSYDAVITLLLRARFDDGWTPRRAGPAAGL